MPEHFSPPFRSISTAAIGGALLYFISPIDLIPDFIPIVGLTDDAAILVSCPKMCRDDVLEYRKWKSGTACEVGLQGLPRKGDGIDKKLNEQIKPQIWHEMSKHDISCQKSLAFSPMKCDTPA